LGSGVFAEIAASAARLCDANDAVIRQVDGEFLRRVAHHGPLPVIGTLPLARGFPLGRAVLDRRTIHVADLQAELEEYPEGSDIARSLCFRTILAVPLIRTGAAIGVFNIRRTEARLFSDKQIALLETFANQAVIAIENTRLFEAERARTKEVEAKSAELAQSLQYQTAISEVLSIISRSPTNVQPVFDTIARSAAQLCKAKLCNVFRFDGQLLHVVASHLPEFPEGQSANANQPSIRPGRGSTAARAVASRTVVVIPDVDQDPDYEMANIARFGNVRSTMAVPMLKDGCPIGAIAVGRSEAGVYPEQLMELLRTFADQAVIAIENTRLFEAEQASKRELQESLEYQISTSDVLSVISHSKFELQPVLDAIAKIANRLCAADATIGLEENGELRIAAHFGPIVSRQRIPHLRAINRDWVSGRTIVDREPIHVHDLAAAGVEFPLGHELANRLGFRTTLGIPLLRENEAIGCLLLRRQVVEPFTEKQIALLKTFANESVIAIENTRLFEEIAQKSRELEVASQHKSQFVANMSHELRTPLAAMLGYAELLQEGIYGAPPEKFLPILTRIRSNGKHLLGLINTVLDIAKIESGQFTLNMAEYALDSVVETVRSATESLAQNKKLALKTVVAKPLPIGLGDEQRLTQVLLNLVGNAIKFTDTGEVCVTAKAENGHFAVSVMDTGPGIPEQEQARIFEQFHQVDSSLTKAKGGTGLGLAIAKQIVEMHGGRIWVESTPGRGSTFQMELPTRAEFRKRPL
jgi:signal transduction histidine kinase/putative methionine-R-sulfoxide reductase with GAF domain